MLSSRVSQGLIQKLLSHTTIKSDLCKCVLCREVLKQYESFVANLPSVLQKGSTSISVAVDAFKPDADILAMMEGSRTGDFRPTPHIYENIESEEASAAFGIDLRKQQGWMSSIGAPGLKAEVPGALDAMLKGLLESYDKLADDREYGFMRSLKVRVASAINHI